MDCASQTHETDNIGLQTKTETEQLQQNNTQNLNDLTIPDMDYIHKVTQNLPEKDNWEPFRKKGMHFLHLNVNSLLPKIHEIRKIAHDSKATIIGITETKLDKTIFDNEVNIDGYNIIRKDRTRHGGGVCCYIKNDRSFNVRENFGTDFENVFLDILLPNSKPILIGILYRPPNQSGFLDSLSTAILNSEKSDNQEVYLLGDLNFNLLDSKGKYILDQNHEANTTTWYKQYRNLCISNNLKQLIRLETRTAKGTFSLLDHILTNTDELVLQSGVVDVGLSDHQLIYCTRKKHKEKLYKHKTFNTRSYKNYTAEKFVEQLSRIPFPNYLDFNDIHEAFYDFSTNVEYLVNQIAPIKSFRVKGYTEDWFDGEIMDCIRDRDKLLRKYKKTKLAIDYEIYKKARNEAKELINSRKISFYEETIKENTGNSKKIWSTLKSMGLPNKKGNNPNICLKTDGKISFDAKENANTFKNFYANLAEDLVRKLPNPKGNFGGIYRNIIEDFISQPAHSNLRR